MHVQDLHAVLLFQSMSCGPHFALQRPTHPHGRHRCALAQCSAPQLSHTIGHSRRVRPHIQQQRVLGLQLVGWKNGEVF